VRSQETIVFWIRFRLEEKGKRVSLWMKPWAFWDCDQTSSNTHQAHLLWPHHRHLSGDTKYRHRGNWWKAVWVTKQKCLSTDDSVSACVFLYCLCIFPPKKNQLFSCRMKLAPFHTLKANIIQLPLDVAEKILFCFDNQTRYKNSW